MQSAPDQGQSQVDLDANETLSISRSQLLVVLVLCYFLIRFLERDNLIIILIISSCLLFI